MHGLTQIYWSLVLGGGLIHGLPGPGVEGVVAKGIEGLRMIGALLRLRLRKADATERVPFYKGLRQVWGYTEVDSSFAQAGTLRACPASRNRSIETPARAFRFALPGNTLLAPQGGPDGAGPSTDDGKKTMRGAATMVI